MQTKQPERVYLRITSHRARDKFGKLGIAYEHLCSFTRGHYFIVEPEHEAAVLAIKGIRKTRKPNVELIKPWGR